MNINEYLLHIWGGAWNSDANPSIEKDYGIKEGYHYLKTEEELERLCNILDKKEYSNHPVGNSFYRIFATGYHRCFDDKNSRICCLNKRERLTPLSFVIFQGL